MLAIPAGVVEAEGVIGTASQLRAIVAAQLENWLIDR